MSLSTPQQRVLDAIVLLTDYHGYPPTVREIGDYIGTASTSTVHTHLMNLRRLGYISNHPDKPRTIKVIRQEMAAE